MIELSQDERVELERRAATVTLAWRVVQRARIVLYAAEEMQDIDRPFQWTFTRHDLDRVLAKIAPQPALAIASNPDGWRPRCSESGFAGGW